MNREYHKWWSWRLDRDMELLVFGHGGVPIVVFPSSQGRFFEFEDRGLIGAVAHKIDRGQIQLFCVDSVDSESWYNRNVPPRWRIAPICPAGHFSTSFCTRFMLPALRCAPSARGSRCAARPTMPKSW